MSKVDELKEFDCLDLIELSDFIEVIKDLKNKDKFVIFTGAGVSKKSGLPNKIMALIKYIGQ